VHLVEEKIQQKEHELKEVQMQASSEMATEEEPIRTESVSLLEQE
jgi:hypothetical protein